MTTIKQLHALLILSDSALPLGSFAFSSGLESYLSHKQYQPKSPSFMHFLESSLISLAALLLPFISAAFNDPKKLMKLDNDLDASMPCTVARRASVAQGQALLSVWKRSLQATTSNTILGRSGEESLRQFSQELDAVGLENPLESPVNGHLAPIWAVVCFSQGINLQETCYLFLLNHAKAVLAAAVRASVMGPYQAQALLASAWLRDRVVQEIEENAEVSAEDAGQKVPLMDLWVGRHELLYSRIFNS